MRIHQLARLDRRAFRVVHVAFRYTLLAISASVLIAESTARDRVNIEARLHRAGFGAIYGLMAATFLYRISTEDIAQLLGRSETSVKRDLKRARINRRCFPSLVRWLFIQLELAHERDIDAKSRWKDVIERQKQERSTRSKAAKEADIGARLRASKADNGPIADAFAQAFPSYD